MFSGEERFHFRMLNYQKVLRLINLDELPLLERKFNRLLRNRFVCISSDESALFNLLYQGILKYQTSWYINHRLRTVFLKTYML